MCWHATQEMQWHGANYSRTAKWRHLVQRPTSPFPLLPGGSRETSLDLILLFPFIYLALKTMYITALLGQLSHLRKHLCLSKRGTQLSRGKMSFPPVFLLLPSLSRLEKHCFHSVSFAALLVCLSGGLGQHSRDQFHQRRRFYKAEVKQKLLFHWDTQLYPHRGVGTIWNVWAQIFEK